MMQQIDLIVFDFDGVMTDNRVLVDETGKESVWVNRSDGLGVRMLKDRGMNMIILSTEANPVVEVRAKKLGVKVIRSVKDKAETLIDYCRQEKFDFENVMYVGNDINDLPAMKLVGLKVVPADAYKEVKAIADIVLETRGGYGVVREIATMIGDNYDG